MESARIVFENILAGENLRQVAKVSGVSVWRLALMTQGVGSTPDLELLAHWARNHGWAGESALLECAIARRRCRGERPLRATLLVALRAGLIWAKAQLAPKPVEEGYW